VQTLLSTETSHEILDVFLARTQGDIEIESYNEYVDLMHGSGLPEALSTIIRQDPRSERVGQRPTLHHLALRNTSSRIIATTYENDRGPTMIQYRGGTPKEAYYLYLKAGWLGDIVTRQGLRSVDRETYMTRDIRDTIRSAADLSKLVRLARKPLERFAQLTVV
jgi:hypothetical protein